MIKQRTPFFLALLAIPVLGYFVLDTLFFLNRAQPTTGEVTEVTSYNSRCGGGRRRRSYPCTKYSAKVAYRDQKFKSFLTTLSAGSRSGSGMPLSSADYKVGQKLKMLYDPNKPDRVYVDSLWGVWSGHIMGLIFQLAMFFTSFCNPKRNNFRVHNFNVS